MDIIVKGNLLTFNGKEYQCAIGKEGFVQNKSEGDNKTPLGIFPLREVFYRDDEPKTKLKTTQIRKDMGWCDDSDDENYNCLIKLPSPAKHEKMWRDDALYDLVIAIGYNDEPPIRGKGSAIFMHIAKPNYAGTEGCVALKKDDLLEILEELEKDTFLQIS